MVRFRSSYDAVMAVLVLAFVASLLPWAGTFLTHYPDERHYTDGAIQFMQGGDWLTPRTPEGDLRLRKPIITYWLVAGGFETLGINPLAARLPFLLCGLGVVVLTWRLGAAVYGDGRVGFLAALIMASHYQWMRSSTMSMPDAPLVLAMLVAAYGAVRMIQTGERRASWLWMLYGGVGLAVATKGLLALVLLGYVWVFVAVSRRRGGDGSRPCWPWGVASMAAGLAIASAWYAAMVSIHGRAALDAFWGDQVGGKVVGDWWAPAWRMPAMLGILVANFLPWTLAVPEMLVQHRRAFRAKRHDLRRVERFILGWALVLAALVGTGDNLSMRYVLPAAPLVAVYLAAVFCRTRRRVTRGAFARLLAAGSIVVVGAAVVLGLVNAQLVDVSHGLAVAAGFVAVAAGVAYWCLRVRRIGRAMGLALLIVCGWGMLFLAAAGWALPDQGQQIAGALVREGIAPDEPVVYIGKPGLASKVRLWLVGQVQFEQFQRTPEKLPSDRWILMRRREALKRPDVARISTAAVGASTDSIHGLAEAVFTWRLAAWFDEHRERYMLVRVAGEGGDGR